MERTKWALYEYDHLDLGTLEQIEDCLSKEELSDIRRKMREVLSPMSIDTPEKLAWAEKIFKLGYLASYAEYQK